MTTLTASRVQLPESGTLITIAVAGFAGAVIDAMYFSTLAVLKGHSPIHTLQGIAGFWFGARTFDLGTSSAIVGAATHIALATIMAAGLWLLSRHVGFVRRFAVLGGLAYGLLLYATMYFVVMPLRWPTIYPRWTGWNSVLDIGVHLIIGVAFALIFRARARGETSPFGLKLD